MDVSLSYFLQAMSSSPALLVTVLLTLNCRVNGDTEGAEGELLGEAANLMKTLGSNARTAQEASEDQLVQKYFYDVIQQYNMSAFSNAQK